MKYKFMVLPCCFVVCLSLLFVAALAGQAVSLADLEKELHDSVGLQRRLVARKIMAKGKVAAKQIIQLAKDEDMVIRRNATLQLRPVLAEEAIPLLRELIADKEVLVRLTAVDELLSFQPRSDSILAVLRKATDDPDDEVRKKAAAAFWDFHRDYISLRKRPDWDLDIKVLIKQPMPLDGWRFRLDRGRSGHLEKWFAPDLNDSSWDTIGIGKWWDVALPDKANNYEGVAWYRIAFEAPPEPVEAFNEVVMHFEAVDESAWVWINGQFAGEHDLGTAGWNTPFDIEVGSLLKWGQANQLTVRVGNALGAGGIHKPVEMQILK